ncbi:MAG: hypothetical protein ABI456_21935, partial [Ktedonobacteraceae bacterium]
QRILAEIRSGQMVGQPARATNNHHHELLPLPPVREFQQRRPRSGALPFQSRSRRDVYNFMVLAAVAVLVLASVGILGRLMVLRSSTSGTNSTSTVTPPPQTFSDGWDAIVISLSLPGSEGQVSIYNYAPFVGKKVRLLSDCCDAASAIDGISHSGRNVLYHTNISGKTRYRLLTGGDLATLDCQCRNGDAIWTTDDRYVLVNTPNHVVQLTLSSGKSETVAGALQATRLLFYRFGYLYFTRSAGEQTSSLYRISIPGGQEQQVVARALDGPDSYWLSPDGGTIYYEGTAERPGMYAVDWNGAHQRLLRSERALPIGFAENNALVFSRQIGKKFEVVKLGNSVQRDQVLLSDAAPGAISISGDGFALAPYGYKLVVQAVKPDGSISVLAYDLAVAQKSQPVHILNIPAPIAPAAVQLVGWDQLPVTHPGGGVSPTPTPSPVGWNGVIVSSSPLPVSPTSPLDVENYNYLDGHHQAPGSSTGHTLPPGAQLDGISPGGVNLAYHLFSGGRTVYSTLSLDQTFPVVDNFYSMSGQGGNAVWMDSHTLLVNAVNTIVKVDIQTNTESIVLASLGTPHLVFYRAPFLYFIGGETRETGALYRISIAGGQPLQLVTMPSPGSTFWLSPDGRTVYYVNKGAGGLAGIYAVYSNGMNLHRLRGDGVPIGYAPDNSLIIMRQVGVQFEVVQLGATPQQDEVLLSNVAPPGAVSLCGTAVPVGIMPICNSDIALAPYAHALVIQAYYKDGTHKVISYDLDSPSQEGTLLLTADSHTQVQLIGWDQLPPQ